MIQHAVFHNHSNPNQLKLTIVGKSTKVATLIGFLIPSSNKKKTMFCLRLDRFPAIEIVQNNCLVNHRVKKYEVRSLFFIY